MSEEKNSLKTKISNLITYYKWYVLIALFFVVVITIMIVQACGREKYDISVMYAGNAILTDNESAEMEKAFEALAGEEEKAVLYELTIMNETELEEAWNKGYSAAFLNNKTIRENRETFVTHVMSDEYFILLLSPECYETLMSNNALESLDSLGITTNGERYGEYALKLHSLEYAKENSAFSALPQDTLLCFKKMSELNENKKDKQTKRTHDTELFKRFVSYSVSGGSTDGAVLSVCKEEM